MLMSERTVECAMCGDRHEVTMMLGVEWVGCPLCPPEGMYLIDRRFIAWQPLREAE